MQPDLIVVARRIFSFALSIILASTTLIIGMRLNAARIENREIGHPSLGKPLRREGGSFAGIGFFITINGLYKPILRISVSSVWTENP